MTNTSKCSRAQAFNREPSVAGEAFKFLLVGAANTAITYLVYLFINIWLPYHISWSMAYLLGIVMSYLLQAKWVFRMPLSWKKFMAFPLVYVVQWLIGITLLATLIELFGVNETVAPLVVVAATLPVTFFLSRYIVRAGADAYGK